MRKPCFLPRPALPRLSTALVRPVLLFIAGKLWHSGVPFQVRRRQQLLQQGRTCCFDSSLRGGAKRNPLFGRIEWKRKTNEQELSRGSRRRRRRGRAVSNWWRDVDCIKRGIMSRGRSSASFRRLKFSVTARRTPEIENINRSGCSFVDRLWSASSLSSTMTSAWWDNVS